MTRLLFRAIAACSLLLAVSAIPLAAHAQEFRLRMGHDQPLGSMYDEGHQMFRKLVEERSAGRIKVEVFPAAQLGAEVAMLEGVRLGSIDVICANAANAATVVPELGLFSVAYLFKDIPHFERVIGDARFGKRIDELIAARKLGIRSIGFYSAGVRNVYSRKGSIAGPDDLKGVKLRVQNNPVEVRVWETLGAIPTPMNFGEVYQALQSGVLDAAENGLAVVESNKHYEAAKFISQTEHQRSLALLIINERKLASLPADLQKVVLDAAAQAAVHERKKDAEFVAAAADRLKAKGAVLTSPDKAKFVSLIAPIQNDVAKELKAQELLQIVRAHAL
ncbi:TRAP transporter substrate-binding protein [Piscinibacter sp.]|uniref:TRAP transporter substrate-binding protein n=1 Tax=Piscinibacter sp. TaxID=1903157 RepID=UPI002C2C3F3E|nr:TRAP transporter substrate-binding protein [Albitalea sp.]HUG22509.1 TRAP transporter substrate-binding protein [Albitalea sp.]